MDRSAQRRGPGVHQAAGAGSGSLKELAAAYGISYPTVRVRLDRLIEKLKILDSVEITSGFERVLRMQYAEGKLDLATLQRLLAAHRAEVEGRP